MPEKHIGSLVLCAAMLLACGQRPGTHPHAPVLAEGPWQMQLDLDSTAGYRPLPFNFELHRSPGQEYRMVIHNQEEAITVDSVVIMGDSLFIQMPFFNSAFRGHIVSDSVFAGHWTNHYKGPDYQIPFTARAGAQPRFPNSLGPPVGDITGDWENYFQSPSGPEPAIGIFTSEEGRVRGTFATETGDLRFLEGVHTGDSLYLSSFNGSQAYLFRAKVSQDSMVGEFLSGHRWKQEWSARRSPGFALSDEEKLTQLDRSHPVDFSLPDVDGNIISYSDARFRGKVVALEIMGTWCPNCLDQARMMKEFHQAFHAQGLETVAMAFEHDTDPGQAAKALRNFRNRLALPYPLLFAGSKKRENVAARLPFLRQLKAYPTTLLIGRDGQVRHIYTGIYGPGTGERYHRFRSRMERAIQQLLDEPPPLSATGHQ